MTTFKLMAIFSVRRGQLLSKIIQDDTLQNSYWYFSHRTSIYIPLKILKIKVYKQIFFTFRVQ